MTPTTRRAKKVTLGPVADNVMTALTEVTGVTADTRVRDHVHPLTAIADQERTKAAALDPGTAKTQRIEVTEIGRETTENLEIKIGKKIGKEIEIGIEREMIDTMIEIEVIGEIGMKRMIGITTEKRVDQSKLRRRISERRS
jgi:hypothetical protein